jgi:hypothetical protein
MEYFNEPPLNSPCLRRADQNLPWRICQANSSRSFAEARYQQTARRLTGKGPDMESVRPAGQLLEIGRA